MVFMIGSTKMINRDLFCDLFWEEGSLEEQEALVLSSDAFKIIC